MDDPVRASIGRAIRVLRTERGLSRKRLAEEIGMSYAYLSEIESGKKRPSSGVLEQIARGLEVRASHIVARAEDWHDRIGSATERASWFSASAPMPTMAALRPMDERDAIAEMLRRLSDDDVRLVAELVRRLADRSSRT